MDQNDDTMKEIAALEANHYTEVTRIEKEKDEKIASMCATKRAKLEKIVRSKCYGLFYGNSRLYFTSKKNAESFFDTQLDGSNSAHLKKLSASKRAELKANLFHIRKVESKEDVDAILASPGILNGKCYFDGWGNFQRSCMAYFDNKTAAKAKKEQINTK